MDKKQIQTILKNEGLDVAEEMAVSATRAAIQLLRKLLPELSAGFGFAFNMFLNGYETKIYEFLDKIDGKDDPGY